MDGVAVAMDARLMLAEGSKADDMVRGKGVWIFEAGMVEVDELVMLFLFNIVRFVTFSIYCGCWCAR